MNVSKPSRSAREIWEDKTLPLWRRTQLRRDLLATFVAQRMNMSDGFDELIQLQSAREELAWRELILRLKQWEERGAGNRTT